MPASQGNARRSVFALDATSRVASRRASGYTWQDISEQLGIALRTVYKNRAAALLLRKVSLKVLGWATPHHELHCEGEARCPRYVLPSLSSSFTGDQDRRNGSAALINSVPRS